MDGIGIVGQLNQSTDGVRTGDGGIATRNQSEEIPGKEWTYTVKSNQANV
jgi:hypothetical protein